jgi:hypothetical protein
MQPDTGFTSAGSPDTWTHVEFRELVDEAHLTLYMLDTMQVPERARLRAILVRMRGISKDPRHAAHTRLKEMCALSAAFATYVAGGQSRAFEARANAMLPSFDVRQMSDATTAAWLGVITRAPKESLMPLRLAFNRGEVTDAALCAELERVSAGLGATPILKV